MDKTFIIGAIISFGLAYWGIWHTNKSKTKTSISLLDQNWMSLLTTFEDNFKILKLENYQLPLNTNLYYYKGIILNSGNTDIYDSRIFSPLKIKLGENQKILELRLNKKQGDQIGLQYEKLDDSVTFTWNLLKPLESFSFELIIETKKVYGKYSFQNVFKVDHRIADVKKIDRIDGWNLKGSIKKNYFGLYIGLLFFAALSSFGVYHGIKSFVSPEVELVYSPTLKSNNQPVTFEYFTKDTVRAMYNNNFIKLNRSDIKDLIDTNPAIEYKKNDYVAFIIASIFLIFVLLGFIGVTKEVLEEYRKSKIIKSLNVE